MYFYALQHNLYKIHFLQHHSLQNVCFCERKKSIFQLDIKKSMKGISQPLSELLKLNPEASFALSTVPNGVN